jgi:hypothetical protein
MGQCSVYIMGTVRRKIWSNRSGALRQSVAIITENWRANSVKSLVNASCHGRSKKYLTLHYASSAEPPPGINETRLAARGKLNRVSCGLYLLGIARPGHCPNSGHSLCPLSITPDAFVRGRSARVASQDRPKSPRLIGLP